MELKLNILERTSGHLFILFNTPMLMANIVFKIFCFILKLWNKIEELRGIFKVFRFYLLFIISLLKVILLAGLLTEILAFLLLVH